jgi:hypothetical protein
VHSQKQTVGVFWKIGALFRHYRVTGRVCASHHTCLLPHCEPVATAVAVPMVLFHLGIPLPNMFRSGLRIVGCEYRLHFQNKMNSQKGLVVVEVSSSRCINTSLEELQGLGFGLLHQ